MVGVDREGLESQQRYLLDESSVQQDCAGNGMHDGLLSNEGGEGEKCPREVNHGWRG